MTARYGYLERFNLAIEPNTNDLRVLVLGEPRGAVRCHRDGNRVGDFVLEDALVWCDAPHVVVLREPHVAVRPDGECQRSGAGTELPLLDRSVLVHPSDAIAVVLDEPDR